MGSDLLGVQRSARPGRRGRQRLIFSGGAEDLKHMKRSGVLGEGSGSEGDRASELGTSNGINGCF